MKPHHAKQKKRYIDMWIGTYHNIILKFNFLHTLFLLLCDHFLRQEQLQSSFIRL